jgi:hypothetical protein
MPTSDQTSLETEWAYALDTYAKPGVAADCLLMQDRLGVSWRRNARDGPVTRERHGRTSASGLREGAFVQRDTPASPHVHRMQQHSDIGSGRDPAAERPGPLRVAAR